MKENIEKPAYELAMIEAEKAKAPFYYIPVKKRGIRRILKVLGEIVLMILCGNAIIRMWHHDMMNGVYIEDVGLLKKAE